MINYLIEEYKARGRNFWFVILHLANNFSSYKQLPPGCLKNDHIIWYLCFESFLDLICMLYAVLNILMFITVKGQRWKNSWQFYLPNNFKFIGISWERQTTDSIVFTKKDFLAMNNRRYWETQQLQC